jgi:hypothetical protein
MLFLKCRCRPRCLLGLRRLRVSPELSLTCSHSQFVRDELCLDREHVGEGGYMVELDCLDLADGVRLIAMLLGEADWPMERGDAGAREDGDTWEGSPGKSMVGLERIDNPSRGAGDFGQGTEE